jgi:hypothetical protein
VADDLVSSRLFCRDRDIVSQRTTVSAVVTLSASVVKSASDCEASPVEAAIECLDVE